MMETPSPRVFTIAPDRPFLSVLADAVLEGFPRAEGGRPSLLELPRWTILLPTRRAVRELERVFFERSGGRGLLLPNIKPIGDIDELSWPAAEEANLQDTPPAISASGQLLALIDLIDDWALSNPQTRLAQDIRQAPHQAHALALSLSELLDGLETESVDMSRMPELYGLETARHREAILEFLDIARLRYPSRLDALKLLSPAALRSLVLRREARRLDETPQSAPVIAAGSTGSIPATRELLKAISRLPHGAVVLPGLDGHMDDASWEAVGPPHPQHALKQLLDSLPIDRRMVAPVPGGNGATRGALASELMRPAETSDSWRDAIATGIPAIAEAMTGVELIEARHVQEEAVIVALILRHCLETPGKTASLVTPDRQLARRVKAELRRWDIGIDDSGGEPLIRFAGASLLHLLIDAIDSGFAAEPLIALLRHDLCRFGQSPETARHLVSIIDLALLRNGQSVPHVGSLQDALCRQRELVLADSHRHMALRRIGPAEWEQAIVHAGLISQTLASCLQDEPATLAGYLDRLTAACMAMSGDMIWDGAAGEMLQQVLAALRTESGLLRSCDRGRAFAIVKHALMIAAVRQSSPRRFRLSVLGLLEARLMQPDLVVLAGLNEGVWPSLPDAGPWLNRPMRDILGLQQPERSIGQTAHDFIQAFGAPEVKLVWSRRRDDAPAIPSRWVLRLQMLLNAAGMKEKTGSNSEWPRLARALGQPPFVRSAGKPQPAPPVMARPKRLSVTRIETLIRDPYSIYAEHVLDLTPVDAIATAPDLAKRGTVIHAAIGDFLGAHPGRLPDNALAVLIACGRHHFEDLREHPSAFSFWWPRFERIAAWLVGEEQSQRDHVRRTFAEIAGALELEVTGGSFLLTCRADRIDMLTDGTARIVDYKTGAVPTAKQVQSGLSPQLTLQAAILEGGGFLGLDAKICSELVYIRLGGGEPAGEYRRLKLDADVMTVAHRHRDGLLRLLEVYARPEQCYLPRIQVEREDEERDYDHLSRFREWALSGKAS